MEKVNAVVLPGLVVRMVLASKDLEMTGAVSTVRPAWPYPTFAPPVVLTPVTSAPMRFDVFVYVPAAFPWTLTENVQEVAAVLVIEPAFKLIVLEPAAAVTVPVIVAPPVQAKPDTVGGLATTRPSGNVSVKATPVKLVVWGLPTVNVSVL